MWARLCDNWVYGGVTLSLVLLSLMPLIKPALSDAGFLTLLCLPVYAVHQWEEHDNNRFVTFVNSKVAVGRRGLTTADSFIINVVGVWFALAATLWLVERSGQAGWALIGFFLLLVNGAAHVVGAMRLRQGNPGFWTALVLFLPFGLWGAWHIWTAASEPQILVSLGLILVLHILIIAQAMRPKEA